MILKKYVNINFKIFNFQFLNSLKNFEILKLFMAFTPISKLISKKFGWSPLAKNVTAALVCDEFNQLILNKWGEKIKDTARAMYLKDRILTVACLSPVVAQEIKMRESELLDKLNDKFGSGVVERLRLLT